MDSQSQFSMIFEKYGAIAPKMIGQNEVWLDVGNRIDDGCIDHHQSKDYNSTIVAMIDNTKYLKNLKNSYLNNQEIKIHMHETPDLDCISCFYVLKKYLEMSEEEFNKLYGVDGSHRKIVDFIDDIDAGKGKKITIPTLYSLYSYINSSESNAYRANRELLDKALKLLEVAENLLNENPDIDLTSYDFSDIDSISKDFEIEIQEIKKATSIYQREKDENIVSIETIGLWNKEGKIEYVKSAIWNKFSEESLKYNGYAYARDEGCVLTVVPYKIKGQNGSSTTSVFASLNPDINGTDKLTLLPVAEIIEQMEQVEEQTLFESSGRYRRDHSRPRDFKGLLGSYPFAVTSDPWFITTNEDLLYAPREQSVLDYQDILEIIRNNGSAVKRSALVKIFPDSKEQEGSKKPEVYLSNELQPISKWTAETRQKLLCKDNPCHTVVFAEVDSSLVRHNNKLLESLCSNLLGHSSNDSLIGKMMHIDYNSYIYSSLECTIILVATYTVDRKTQKSSFSSTLISQVLNLSSADDLINSPLIKDIMNINQQRYELNYYRKKIGELSDLKRKSKRIDDIYRKLLKRSVQTQKDENINNQVQRELYNFIKDEFQIEKLSSSIMNEIEILVSESKERMVSYFNFISAVAVPFLLVSTLFQIGMIKFENIFELDKSHSLVGWIVAGVLTAVVTALVHIISKKGKD